MIGMSLVLLTAVVHPCRHAACPCIGWRDWYTGCESLLVLQDCPGVLSSVTSGSGCSAARLHSDAMFCVDRNRQDIQAAEQRSQGSVKHLQPDLAGYLAFLGSYCEIP